MEKIKARVQNPVRGGAWVSAILLQALNLSQLFSNRQGTLARPPGNNPRRFFLCEPERGTDKPEEPELAAPSSGTAAEPPHTDNPGHADEVAEIGRFVGFVEKR